MITSELVDKVLVQIKKRYSNYEYFFEKLSSPEWIPHLSEKGFFKQPFDVVRQDGYISFPVWPQSEYLSRMASLDPSIVRKTILAIPPNDNLRIHLDFINAALAMPIKDGHLILEREVKWLRNQPYIYFLLPEKMGEAIIHLASNGDKMALELAAALLDVSSKDSQDGTETEISIKMELYEYERILKKVFPILVSVAPEDTLNLLCSLLERSVKIKIGSKADLSCYWQAAIEDHSQNTERDVANYLVAAIREAIEKIVTTSEVVENIVNSLRKRKGTIFERIVLHTLRVKFSLNKLLAKKTILDEQLFRNIIVQHEYTLLLKEGFGELSEDEQELVFGWIKEGPRYNGSPSTDCENAWRRDKLSIIEEHLFGEWKKIYNKLIDDYGPARHPGFPVYHETRIGNTSPLNVEQMSKTSIPDLIKFLITWEPEEGWAKPTREGLARVLFVVAKSQPERFAEEAESFKAVDATYVNNLISGLTQAVEDNRVFNWLPVLNLCKWIVNEPIEIPGRVSEYGDIDKGWTWTRRSIASLLRVGFQERKTEISYQHQELCWSIVSELVEDKDPTIEDEARFLSSRSDPLDYAIGTIRGEALFATVEYGVWVKRFWEYSGQGGCFRIDSISEIKNVLERHLDVQVDPSVAIRAMYGHCFVRLVALDKEWVKGITNKVFPTGTSLEKYRWAAWQSYVLSWNIIIEVYEILQGEYKWAVSSLSQPIHDDKNDRVLARVIEHLMVLYSWAVITITSDDGLIKNFFEIASDKVRANAIETTGRWLKDEDIPEELCERLQALWEWRKQYQDAAPDKYREEIMSFGWLFSLDQFEAAWSVAELIRVVKLVGTAKPSWLVIEHLDSPERISADQALDCLDLLIRGFKEPWTIHHVKDHIESIIERALQEMHTKQKAQSLKDYLISKGYREFLK